MAPCRDYGKYKLKKNNKQTIHTPDVRSWRRHNIRIPTQRRGRGVRVQEENTVFAMGGLGMSLACWGLIGNKSLCNVFPSSLLIPSKLAIQGSEFKVQAEGLGVLALTRYWGLECSRLSQRLGSPCPERSYWVARPLALTRGH